MTSSVTPRIIAGAFVIGLALASSSALADKPVRDRPAPTKAHTESPDTAPKQHKAKTVTDVLSTELLSKKDREKRYEDNPNPLSHLLGLRRGDGIGIGNSKNGENNIRTQAMQQEGQLLGSQAGLRWRNRVILNVVEQYSSSLSKAYNFGPLMIDQVVVPPVIGRIENATRKYDDRTMRSVKVGYRLEHAARIVTTQPTWRNFLIRHFARPETPPNVLLPRNGSEVKIWERAVRTGWRNGVAQADGYFKRSLNLLTSTYLGILQYKVLLSEHVVSPPNLATTNLRITSHGHALNIGDRVYRITRDSQFTDSRGWDAVPTAPSDAR